MRGELRGETADPEMLQCNVRMKCTLRPTDGTGPWTTTHRGGHSSGVEERFGDRRARAPQGLGVRENEDAHSQWRRPLRSVACLTLPCRKGSQHSKLKAWQFYHHQILVKTNVYLCMVT